MAEEPSEARTRATESGPFAHAAPDLVGRGLAVIPCGGEDGKVPLVRWRGWKRPPTGEFVSKLTRWHANANIGVLTGLSRVTVVDCDAPEAVEAMIDRCGESPLKTLTPSGGMHIWYRSSGERSSNLRAEGLHVDVKGIGGFVVVPPSIRPCGIHAGKPYRFIDGDWNDLARLPSIRPGALRATGALNDAQHPRNAVQRGQRNRTLLTSLLREAPHCDDLGALMDRAETIAEGFDYDPDDPFTASEVRKTALSAWKMESQGRNWVGKEAKVYMTASEINALAAHRYGADGSLLLMRLRLAHWNDKAFAVSPKAMARAGIIPGWAHGRYRNARSALTDVRLLLPVHEGGHGKKDPSLFAFTGPVIGQGLESGHNIIKHPLSCPIADQNQYEKSR